MPKDGCVICNEFIYVYIHILKALQVDKYLLI